MFKTFIKCKNADNYNISGGSNYLSSKIDLLFIVDTEPPI